MEQSLYIECWYEADRHKWIESQKFGRDLGGDAVRDWFRRYWPIYCRIARLEHVAGLRYWREFPREDFRLLDRLNDVDHRGVLEWVLPQARRGSENLDLIIGAFDTGLPVERVLKVLEVLHLNAGRLDPPADAPPQFARPRPVKSSA